MSKRVMHHVCIQTEKYEESLRFYRDILEFNVVKETKGFHGRDVTTILFRSLCSSISAFARRMIFPRPVV